VCDENADLCRVSRDQGKTGDRATAAAHDRRRLLKDVAQHAMDVIGEQFGRGDLSPVSNRAV
jgi:hypothetical protein